MVETRPSGGFSACRPGRHFEDLHFRAASIPPSKSLPLGTTCVNPTGIGGSKHIDSEQCDFFLGGECVADFFDQLVIRLRVHEQVEHGATELGSCGLASRDNDDVGILDNFACAHSLVVVVPEDVAH